MIYRDQQDQRAKAKARLNKWIRAGLLLMPVLIYLPTFGGDAAVPPGRDTFSDLLITHYPYLIYLRDSILTNFQIPLWSTLIYSGAPFAANPLAGVFYLPGWLAMAFPLPAGISLMVAAHVVFGTWGMYRFLQLRNLRESGRIIGALGFGLMPKIAAHFGAGHVTLIYALSWTPWLLICSEKDQEGWKTGIVAGVLFLADPRWAVYAGVLWISYDIAHRHIILKQRMRSYLKSALMAGLIGAPLLIPLIQYLQTATRAGLSSGDILYGSLPVSGLLGLIIPANSGNIEWYFYGGGVLVALFAVQLFMKALRKDNRFWILWIAVSMLVALGTWGMEANWVSRIPVMSVLRVPARSLFITGICFAVIGGTSIDHLFCAKEDSSGLRKVYFGMVAVGLMMMIGVAYLAQAQPLMILWGFLFFLACSLCLALVDRYPSSGYLEWIFVGILMIDLLGAGLTSYAIQDKERRAPGEIYAYLEEDAGYYRLYSPSYSVPQYLAAELDLEIADGVDPMQIARYAHFMEQASGVAQDGYSVTIPPFKTGNPSLDNINAVPDSQLLGLLNVKYVLSEFDINAEGLLPLSTTGDTRIYLNEYAMPRAWLESVGDDGSKAAFSQVTIVGKTANRIVLEAAGPGKLVLSEVDYPGWRVYVDGKRENIDNAYGLLRSVILPKGDHQVVFVFRPVSVYVGLALAAFGWLVAAQIYLGDQFEKLSIR